MLQRLSHLTNTIQTNWSEDPAARAAAKQAAGAVLVAEGVTGTIRRGAGNLGRRASGRDTNRGRGGLIGGIMGMVMGAIFMVVGSFLSPPDDLIEVPGEISAVIETTNSDGDRAYRPEFVYEVDGRIYEATSNVTSSSRPAVGTSVTIGYPPQDPAAGQRVDGIEGSFHRIFFWAGAFVFVTSLGSLVISIALIVVGIKLFRDGRKERREAGSEQGLFADLMSIVRQRDQLDPELTAAGVSGAGQGPAALGGQPGAPGGVVGHQPPGAAPSAPGPVSPPPPGAAQPTPTAPPPPAQPTGPAPGWYPDPQGVAPHRWWDGTRWTDHTG